MSADNSSPGPAGPPGEFPAAGPGAAASAPGAPGAAASAPGGAGGAPGGAGGPEAAAGASGWADTPARQFLAGGSDVFRGYLTAEIMLAHVTAQALGLSSADFFGLNIVAMRGPVTAGDLALGTGLTSGAATRMIDRLESAGFVRRVHDTADRRRVHVELATDRAGEIDAALEPNRRHLAEVFLTYTPDQLGVLFDYFERATPALLAAAEEIQSRSS
jgi:DNA-binding MarR family transcriptional regulator